jgi:COP9 signalosome complex subunit 1
MGNEDLGQHYHRIGDLNAAAKAFSRMRDYCTTSSQIGSMHFKNIVVAIDARNWLAVQSNVHRLQTLQFRKDEEARCKAKMSAALGLSMLATGAYKDAAVSFMDTDPSLGGGFKEVITPNDVAVYGGLCALASMDRQDLLTRVLEDKNFRSYLELEPHIRRAISFFCSSKFRPCFDILEAYLPDYLLDIYLQSHVRVLYEKIRVKAMQQYIIPYSRVTLTGVAKVFYPGQSVTNEAGATDISSPVVSELISYIQDGVLNARIDLEKGVLAINQAAAREEVHGKAIDMAREYVNTAHLQLLRIGVLNAGLDVPSPRSRGGDSMSSQAEGELFLPSQMGGAGRKGPGSWLSSEASW